jgi:DNA polymerase III epsilon subunit-like protein
MISSDNETIVVLDFETSGISPTQGDRAIEIGAAVSASGKFPYYWTVLSLDMDI